MKSGSSSSYSTAFPSSIIHLTSYILLICVLLGGCKDKKPAPTATNCRLTSVKKIMSRSKATGIYTYEYNTANKLAKTTYTLQGEEHSYTTYDYSTAGKVGVKTFNGKNELERSILYTLNANGYANSEISVREKQDTVSLFEYNADGYLIKNINKMNAHTTTYTIENGNVIKSIDTDSSGKMLYTFTYKYSAQRNNIDYRNNFFGKANANLVTKRTMKGKTNGTTTYSYIFDENGYPSEVNEHIMTSKGMVKIKSENAFDCQ